MIDCPIYLSLPEDSIGSPNPPVDDVIACGGCQCGYIRYENLIPYLPEINDKLKDVNNPESSDLLELKLREQILEVSRIFDTEAGVKPGFFSKAHYTTTKVFPSNGSRYLKVPEHVEGTLVIRTMDDVVLDESSYGLQGGYVVYYPCVKHISHSVS